jgi:hypothetical protein
MLMLAAGAEVVPNAGRAGMARWGPMKGGPPSSVGGAGPEAAAAGPMSRGAAGGAAGAELGTGRNEDDVGGWG